MIKKVLLALGTLVSAFSVTAGLVLAQTTSPSPTATASPTSSPTSSPRTPTGAPATGLGGGY